jgi:hypothetical protein
VQRSCATYAGRILRSHDPTRRGAIRFEILDLRETISVVEPSDEVLRDTYITCIAAAQGDLRLDGSLFGLGNRPLPTG